MNELFRKKLRSATTHHHTAVEAIFGFDKGISAESLDLFHTTMLSARTICETALRKLEINTYNATLIKALKKDLDLPENYTPNINPYKTSEIEISNLSTQLGVFYVFAGSSAGAKILLNTAQKEAINYPLYYFNALVNSSSNQMRDLKLMLSQEGLIEDNIISAAQYTFQLIHDIGTHELKRRNTKLQNT